MPNKLGRSYSRSPVRSRSPRHQKSRSRRYSGSRSPARREQSTKRNDGLRSAIIRNEGINLQERAHERSPRIACGQGRRDKLVDAQKEEESVESRDGESPGLVRHSRGREKSVEHKDDVDKVELRNEKLSCQEEQRMVRDDLYSRKSRTEDVRKRERGDELGSRNRAKARESERSDKDDKDVSATTHGERDDNLKTRHEAVDDYQSKTRKDEESSSSSRKRERDEIIDQRKRNERPRIKTIKTDESLSKGEREEGRDTVRMSGGGSQDKACVAHTRPKDEDKVSEKEYQLKLEDVSHSELVKRREQNDDESFSSRRMLGHRFGNEERKIRQEKSAHEKKHKENTRKNRDPITLVAANGNQQELSGQNNEKETGNPSQQNEELPAQQDQRNDANHIDNLQGVRRSPERDMSLAQSPNARDNRNSAVSHLEAHLDPASFVKKYRCRPFHLLLPELAVRKHAAIIRHYKSDLRILMR